MIGVVDNSPQQINAALIAVKNEVKNDIIDDNTTSSSTTWSSSKINTELGNKADKSEIVVTYPLGYIYMQLYNPTDATFEKSPIQLGMTPPSGCKWEEITSDFASYPYLKIGSRTTQTGHNAYHNHGGYTEYINPRHTHGQNVTANVGGSAVRRDYSNDGSSYSYPQGCVTDYADINHRHKIDYDGNSTEQTVEVNASNLKIWKIVADT